MTVRLYLTNDWLELSKQLYSKLLLGVCCQLEVSRQDTELDIVDIYILKNKYFARSKYKSWDRSVFKLTRIS